MHFYLWWCFQIVIQDLCSVYGRIKSLKLWLLFCFLHLSSLEYCICALRCFSDKLISQLLLKGICYNNKSNLQTKSISLTRVVFVFLFFFLKKVTKIIFCFITFIDFHKNVPILNLVLFPRTMKHRLVREHIFLELSKIKGFICFMTECEIGCSSKKKKVN